VRILTRAWLHVTWHRWHNGVARVRLRSADAA